MQIEIRGTNIEATDELVTLGERRALFALNRFSSRISRVTIVLCDVNGPRGGVDTNCRVRVQSAEGWMVTVTVLDHDARRAMSIGIARAGRAVARQIARIRDLGLSARAHRRAS